MHASLASLSFSATLLALFFAPAFAQHDAIRAVKFHGGVRHTGEHAPLQKRFDGARFTFYNTQTGNSNACGTIDQNSDFIVALNTAQYDGGSHCYEQITMSYGGKTTTATITDELDLSPGLFSFFADTSMGEIYGTWDYNTGASSTSTSSPPPTPTYTPPSSTWQPPPPTSSPAPPPSSSSSSSSSAPWSSSSSSVSPSSSAPASSSSAPSSSSAAPTSSAPATSSTPAFDLGNINQFNIALVGLAGLAAGAARVQ
ncbi:hypothetical protein B0H21DRAFT_18241 [Amylocystis lapponica]|nr:hypothetical protein B0H21DRAFT_18241 [Amylocystis lapponica]